MREKREKREKIGEILVDAGLVSRDQLSMALTTQRRLGGTLGENLVRLGIVTEEALLDALSKQAGLQHVNLARVEVPADIQRLIPLETVRLMRILPIGFEGSRLVVGMVDPTDQGALVEAESLSAHPVKPVILSATHFEQALAFFQAGGYGAQDLSLQGGDAGHEPASTGADMAATGIGALLAELVSSRGQDLHLSAGAVPSIRVDNEIRRLDLPPLKPARLEAMICGILSAEQKRMFRDALEIDFAYSLEGIGRFRCNVYRQRNSVAFIARHVSSAVLSASELGLPDFLLEYALKPQGLILIAGSNGHGKSATLACLVDAVNRTKKANIITIEDPVEYTHQHRSSNVNQREVGTDTLSFADGLRRIFRQGPDVIAVGDLRDGESISVAMTAAETGRLVIAALHAMNATAAIERIVDAFPANRQAQARARLADCLELVFAQRLVRRASGTGRVLAWEKIGSSLRVRNAVREGKVGMLRAMMQTNVEELVGIDWTLAELVASGKVKYDEALKHADSATYLNDLLKVRGAFL
jgi:twitching motility protein PilT